MPKQYIILKGVMYAVSDRLAWTSAQASIKLGYEADNAVATFVRPTINNAGINYVAHLWLKTIKELELMEAYSPKPKVLNAKISNKA